jgi:ABC-2 type transport system permease protein
MAAVFPLLSPEKGSTATGILQSIVLLVSGVYYEIEVLPSWIQPLSRISPATYTLKAVRAAVLHGAPISERIDDLILLFVIGIITIPLGLWIFHLGEVHAKKTGRLKRSG